MQKSAAMVGFFPYEYDMVDCINQPMQRPFKSYQRPAVLDHPTPPYYTPTLPSSPYIGALKFCSVPQQGHFSGPPSIVDYRVPCYYSTQPSRSSVYENNAYNSMSHVFDPTSSFRPHSGYFDSHLDHRQSVGGSIAPNFQSPLVIAPYSTDDASSTNYLARGPGSPSGPSTGSVGHAPSTTTAVTPGMCSDTSTEASSPEMVMKSCKKGAQAVPDEQKDAHYWEKRKKNNESAKKSREARRIKATIAELNLRQLRDEIVRKRIRRDMLLKKVQDLRYENYLS